MVILALLGGLTGACATLNEKTSLEATTAPLPGRGYLYGRFTLTPDSRTQPRLFLHLFDLGRETFLSIPLRQTAPDIYVIDLVPGRYQFTQLVFVPLGAMDYSVRRDNLEFPASISYMGQPFEVQAGKAHYVGDWEATLWREDRSSIVATQITIKWRIERLGFDYERATADLKRLYPALGQLESLPAWRW